MSSPNDGKSAFYKEGLEQLPKSTPCKSGALHFGKRTEGCSSLEKASDLTSSNSDVLEYRKGLFYLPEHFLYFWDE